MNGAYDADDLASYLRFGTIGGKLISAGDREDLAKLYGIDLAGALPAESHVELHIGSESIAFGVVDGIQRVEDCCVEMLGRYERFIVDHAHLIAAYLDNLTAQRFDRAEQNRALVERLALNAGALFPAEE